MVSCLQGRLVQQWHKPCKSYQTISDLTLDQPHEMDSIQCLNRHELSLVKRQRMGQIADESQDRLLPYSVTHLPDISTSVLGKGLNSCFFFFCSVTIKSRQNLYKTVIMLELGIWGNLSLCSWAINIALQSRLSLRPVSYVDIYCNNQLFLFLLFLVFYFFSVSGSHLAQADLRFIMQPMIILNFRSFCFNNLSYEITDVHHHVHFMQCYRLNTELHAFQTSAILAELCPLP